MNVRCRILCLVTILVAATGLTQPSLSRGQADNEQPKAESPKRPKEARLETIVGEIDPDVRSRIVDHLEREVGMMRERLESERQTLKELERQLKDQQAKVRRADLTLTFLKDRLEQWSTTHASGSSE